MPCSDGGPISNTVYCVDPDTKKRLDTVTQLLCGLCHRLTDSGSRGGYTHIANDVELSAWWEKHQAADRIREKRERAKREERQAKLKALSKLSWKEKRLLGIREQ